MQIDERFVCKFSPLRGVQKELDFICVGKYNKAKGCENMPYSEAQKNATMKYKSKNYERISLDVKKGQRDEWKQQAAQRGLSLNAYIAKLMQEDKERLI